MMLYLSTFLLRSLHFKWTLEIWIFRWSSSSGSAGMIQIWRTMNIKQAVNSSSFLKWILSNTYGPPIRIFTASSQSRLYRPTAQYLPVRDYVFHLTEMFSSVPGICLDTNINFKKPISHRAARGPYFGYSAA